MVCKKYFGKQSPGDFVSATLERENKDTQDDDLKDLEFFVCLCFAIEYMVRNPCTTTVLK